VTLDTTSNLSAQQAALSHLSRRPTARIVFDYPGSAQSYASAVQTLHPIADLMGQILDSSYLENVTCPTGIDMAARADDYLGNTTLAADIDLWEIGNEVNGEWLCKGDTNTTYQVIRTAYDKVKAKGKKAALTLFWYDSSCAPSSGYEMFTWVQNHVEPDMRQGLDYVLISVYETACPPPTSWTPIFDQLGTHVPNASLGFGEVGTENQNAAQSTKLTILGKYYGLAPMHPRFIGGDFWWYFSEDMVPYSGNALWTKLDQQAMGWTTLFP
jgi:hypothetical protein